MFTDSSIKRLPARDLPYREFERGEIPGFCLQIQPSGSRTFYLQHTVGDRRRFYRLGPYPHLSLAAARAMAREHLAILATGGDPQAPKRSELGTVADLLDAWLVHQRERDGRRLGDVERAIRGNCSGILERVAVEVTATDIRGILAAIHQRGSRVMANRVRAHLHAMWVYGMRHDHDPRQLHRPIRFGLESNPVVAVPRDSTAERAGERVIQIPEIIEVWNDSNLSWIARQGVRLLFATCGQRVNEIIQSSWDEFDLMDKKWVIPKERTKNRREHEVPLTSLSIQLLTELRDSLPGSKWLFPARNVVWATQPWGGTALGHAITNWQKGKASPKWSPRDIRRTVKTEMGKAGIPKSTRDLLQNHAMSADVSAKHYDRYDYWPEKRKAAEMWDTYLQAKILHPESSVIPFRSKA